MIDPARLSKVALLHEDDDLAVVIKPPGLAVHGGAGETKKTLLDVLADASGHRGWSLVHRLDKATSGIMVVAKRADIASQLGAEWDSTEKNYVALAFGAVRARTMTTPIADKHGAKQSAVTILEPRASLETTTLVDVMIPTGRKHQIRRHLSEAGHPVVLDDKYGDFAANKRFVKAVRARGAPRPKELFLYASRLVLPDGRAFAAALPSWWRAALEADGAAVDELDFLS